MTVNRARMLFLLCKCQEVDKCLATLIHLPCFVSALPLPTSAKSEPVETQLEKINMIEHCTFTVDLGKIYPGIERSIRRSLKTFKGC